MSDEGLRLALRARAVSALGRGSPPHMTPSPLSSLRRLAGCPPGRRAVAGGEACRQSRRPLSARSVRHR
eukprot:3642779-Alexandrium_andersonii.AAC.1